MVDAAENLWVTDFGLARLEANVGTDDDRRHPGHAPLHEPRAGAGQARGRRSPHRHLLAGATLYELLTLRPAFQGDDRQEILNQIAFDEPRSLRKIDAAIPLELETIMLKAMEKNPVDRYDTAQEMADDLQRFLDNRPILREAAFAR